MSRMPPYTLRPKITGSSGPQGTGPMPPRATSRTYARDETQGSSETFVAASVPANPTLFVPVLIALWPEALPRVLHLGAAPDRWTPGVGVSFPPRAFQQVGVTGAQPLSFYAGWINNAGVRLGNGSDQQMAAVVELGCDSSGGEFYFDWVPGSYNLPACKFLRVSAVPYGGAWAALAGARFTVRAAAMAGQMQGAHVPTITGRANLLAATPMAFETPNGLRAVDVEQEDPNATAARIELAGAASASRDYGAGVFLPGWGPVAVVPASGAASGFAMSTSVDCFVTLRGYVQI